MFDKHINQSRTPPQIPIPPPPHRTRIAPIHRQARPRFRIAPIGEDPHTDIADGFPIIKAPAN